MLPLDSNPSIELLSVAWQPFFQNPNSQSDSHDEYIHYYSLKDQTRATREPIQDKRRFGLTDVMAQSILRSRVYEFHSMSMETKSWIHVRTRALTMGGYHDIETPIGFINILLCSVAKLGKAMSQLLLP